MIRAKIVSIKFSREFLPEVLIEFSFYDRNRLVYVQKGERVPEAGKAIEVKVSGGVIS